MNTLSNADRARVLSCLVEGNSIRSTVRMTGVSKNAVARLLVSVGEACDKLSGELIRGVPSKLLQCDEIWAFCYAKDKNVPEEKRGVFGYGDVWTWTAIDADSKLMLHWRVGTRSSADGDSFLYELARRVEGRPQVSTDSWGPYRFGVRVAFDLAVDHATVTKTYGTTQPSGRYSPAVCTGCEKRAAWGSPDMREASTSYVERANLTMRMGMRRFTRLTNAFSKKVENHAHAVALHMTHYNLCRAHISLGGKTPAMAAGLTDHRWTIVELLERLDLQPKRRKAA